MLKESHILKDIITGQKWVGRITMNFIMNEKGGSELCWGLLREFKSRYKMMTSSFDMQ